MKIRRSMLVATVALTIVLGGCVQPPPAPPPPLHVTEQVSSGGLQTCARTTAGVVKCWGANDSGAADISTTPVVVSGLSDPIAISAGGRNVCALESSGTVACWGSNQFGGLGIGTTDTDAHPTPVPVLGIDNAVGISVGDDHTCAVLDDGTVSCWGLTNGPSPGGTIITTTPTMVAGISDATQVTAGRWHSCARIADGTAKCWGVDAFGQVGAGAPCVIFGEVCAREPTLVVGLSDVAEIDAGHGFTCARLADGTVRCWGLNTHGELGDGTTTDSATPVVVSGLTTVTNLSTGGLIGSFGGAACGVVSGGGVRCWGFNVFGGLGTGSSDTLPHPTPEAVVELPPATSVATSGPHTCVVLEDGGLRCWGSNQFGQLGDGTTVDRAIPGTVVGFL